MDTTLPRKSEDVTSEHIGYQTNILNCSNHQEDMFYFPMLHTPKFEHIKTSSDDDSTDMAVEMKIEKSDIDMLPRQSEDMTTKLIEDSYSPMLKMPFIEQNESKNNYSTVCNMAVGYKIEKSDTGVLPRQSEDETTKFIGCQTNILNCSNHQEDMSYSPMLHTPFIENIKTSCDDSTDVAVEMEIEKSDIDMLPRQSEDVTTGHIDFKHPAVEFNEIMSLKGKVIEYSLVSIPVDEKDPVFTVRAKSDNLIVYGCGSSKKEAMSNAAINFVDQMNCNEDIKSMTSTTPNILSTPSTIECNSKKTELGSKLNTVGMLQELCVQRHWKLPSYECISDFSSKNHSIQFKVKCNLRNYTTIGVGHTKLSAKKKAAFFMYNHFKHLKPDKFSINSGKKKINTNLQSNPVGSLHEICMKSHWELPNYECVMDLTNGVHDVVYVYKCSLHNYSTIGEGKKKNLAKKIAALRMCYHLKNSTHGEIVAPCYEEYQSPIKAMLNNNSQTKNGVVKKLMNFKRPDILKTIKGYLINLKESTKFGLSRLENLSIKAVDFLDQIGYENDFNATYINPVLTFNEAQVTVKLPITPNITHMGSGKTVIDAKEKAAYACLLFMKVLLETSL